MITTSWNHNASCKTYEVDGIVVARIRRAPGKKPCALLYTDDREFDTVVGPDLDGLDRICIEHANAF